MKAFIHCIKILVACIFLHSQIVYSQSGDSLRVQSLSPIFPQISFGDSAFESQPYDSITVTVLNLATTLFSGNLKFELEIDTGGGVNADSLIVTTQPVTILAGDSQVVSVNQYFFSSTRYKAGNNVVVVWPRLTTGQLNYSDSLVTQVFFVPDSSSGVDDLEPDFQYSLFPNPSSDFIYLNDKGKKDIEGVRFYDMEGRLIKEFKSTNNNRFNISGFERGCYFMEIILSKQRKMLSRVLKM